MFISFALMQFPADGLFISFALMQKKRTKEKIKAALPGLLHRRYSQTGLELASLRQIAPYLRLTVIPLTPLQ